MKPDVASDVDGGGCTDLNCLSRCLGQVRSAAGLPSRLIRYLVHDTQADANCIEASGKRRKWRKWQAFDPLPGFDQLGVRGVEVMLQKLTLRMTGVLVICQICFGRALSQCSCSVFGFCIRSFCFFLTQFINPLNVASRDVEGLDDFPWWSLLAPLYGDMKG